MVVAAVGALLLPEVAAGIVYDWCHLQGGQGPGVPLNNAGLRRYRCWHRGNSHLRILFTSAEIFTSTDGTRHDLSALTALVPGRSHDECCSRISMNDRWEPQE